jgi:hypothetical protein
MDDPVQVEKSRKTLEECRRDYDNEQKLLEDADREKAEGSARAVSRNDEAASKAKEVVIDKEEDIDHGRNDEPTETERTNTATAPTTDVITYQCMECFLDDTVPSDKQNMRYPIEEFDKHLKSTYHSRPAQKMRASYLAEEPGTMPTEARCPLCGETWSSEEFIQHLAISTRNSGRPEMGMAPRSIGVVLLTSPRDMSRRQTKTANGPSGRPRKPDHLYHRHFIFST